jgi:hypothetical protein
MPSLIIGRQPEQVHQLRVFNDPVAASRTDYNQCHAV